MNNETTIITLFSSDATVQYIKDIFSVLSLPRGSHFTFRYQQDYVDPKVKTLFSNTEKNLNIRALVVFKSKTATADDKSFCIPIRWVRICSVIHISNGYTLDFEIDGYPSYTSDFINQSTNFQGINQSANQFFQNQGTNDYAVLGESLSIVKIDDAHDRDSENWYEIVRRINLIPEYEKYHFLKCSSLYTEVYNEEYSIYEKVNCPQTDGIIKLEEGKCVYVDVEYQSSNYDKSTKRKIDIFVDENILSKAKGLRSALQSRYGTVKLGVQSKKVPNNTVSEIILCTDSSFADELKTEIIFPVIIVKNKLYKLVKALITAIGALFVALPGIIGDNLDVSWNILIAAIGVIVLGINNYYESKE